MKTPHDKIFSIRLNEQVYEDLRVHAEARNLTVADLVRMFIRLGLVAVSDAENGSRLMLKDGDELRPVFLV
jgi:hypothetical protein